MERTDEALKAAFAEVLRGQREALGLTQEQLAERSDISTRHISFMETGKRQPTLSVLVALCNGLGVTLAAFSTELDARLRVARDIPTDK